MNLEGLVLAGLAANFVCVAYTAIWLKNILIEMAHGIEGQISGVETALKTVQTDIDRIDRKLP
jgi:hypothetical protein